MATSEHPPQSPHQPHLRGPELEMLDLFESVLDQSQLNLLSGIRDYYLHGQGLTPNDKVDFEAARLFGDQPDLKLEGQTRASTGNYSFLFRPALNSYELTKKGPLGKESVVVAPLHAEDHRGPQIATWLPSEGLLSKIKVEDSRGKVDHLADVGLAELLDPKISKTILTYAEKRVHGIIRDYHKAVSPARPALPERRRGRGVKLFLGGSFKH